MTFFVMFVTFFAICYQNYQQTTSFHFSEGYIVIKMLIKIN